MSFFLFIRQGHIEKNLLDKNAYSGSNTLLLHPDVHFKGACRPNRLETIGAYVAAGGGLLMCGGYLSFSGFANKARYGMTPLAKVLPVEVLHYDDRMEYPQGVTPVLCQPEHPVLRGVGTDWPIFMGYNKLSPKADAQMIASIGDGDAFMTAMDYGKGRSFTFASDCAPHWASPAFLSWDGYNTLFGNIIRWITGRA